MNKVIRILVALGIIAFGLLTLYLSGPVIFDLFNMRAKQGNYVLFVIWANFICGFIYLWGGYALLMTSEKARNLFKYALYILFFTFIVFIIYVQMGGIHKTDTFKALAVRTGITIIAYLTAKYTISKKNKNMKNENFKKYVLLLLLFFINNTFSQQILSLDQCLNQAMEHNKQLEIAENNVLKSEYQRKEIIANLWPKINGTADYKYYFDLPTQLMPANAFNPMAPEWEFKAAQFGVPHNINANIQAGMPLYNAELFTGIKMSEKAVELQKLNLKKTKEETYVLVSNLYYNAQIIKNQILYTKKNKENLQKLLDDLQLFYEQKLITKNDVDKVRIQVKKLGANLKILNNKYQEILNALKLNMGTRDDFEVTTEIITPELKVPKQKTATDLQMLQKKYELAEWEIKKIKRERLPKLSAFGSYGTIGYGYDEKPHDFLDFYNLSLVGVKLEIPFMDLSRKKKIKQKKIERDNVQIQWELAKDKNRMDIENSKNKVKVQLEVIESQKEQIALAQSVYKKTRMQHKQEMASLTDVLMAENDIIKAQQEYLTAVIEYLKANLELKKLTGNIVE